MPDEPQTDIASLTVQLLSAFVANISLPSERLSNPIRSTARTDGLSRSEA